MAIWTKPPNCQILMGMARDEILDRIERLLERRLAGILTPEEQAELAQLYAAEVDRPIGVVISATDGRILSRKQLIR